MLELHIIFFPLFLVGKDHKVDLLLFFLMKLCRKGTSFMNAIRCAAVIEPVLIGFCRME